MKRTRELCRFNQKPDQIIKCKHLGKEPLGWGYFPLELWVAQTLHYMNELNNSASVPHVQLLQTLQQQVTLPEALDYNPSLFPFSVYLSDSMYSMWRRAGSRIHFVPISHMTSRVVCKCLQMATVPTSQNILGSPCGALPWHRNYAGEVGRR